jgi:beta-lactamase regulating signal transducer with metallopeptidase domain
MTETVITSSLLIVLILILRLVFKGKINQRLQYALWAVVVLRLILLSYKRVDNIGKKWYNFVG